MSERILVPHDGSAAADAAIPWAARMPGSPISLLRVEPDLGPAIGEISGMDLDAWMSSDAATARAELERAARPLVEAGKTVETEVVVGDDPAEEILAAADAEPTGLIVMATHGRGAAGRIIYGSVADRVAHHATVPVLLVRPGEQPADRCRILVPLDGSALSEAALPIGVRLARDLDAALHLVRVVDDEAIVRRIRERVAAGETLPDDAWERVREDLETEARDYLERLAAEAAAGVETMVEVATGTPAFVLLEMILPGDVVVMSSHGESGLRRWLLGTVADKLVREAKAPVLLAPSRPGAES